MTIYLIAGAAAAVVLSVILVVRDLLERRRAYWERRWRASQEDESGYALAALAARKKPYGWAERLDQAFAGVIHRSGLSMTPQQAIGLMVLTGAVIATGLVLWRDDYWLVGLGLVAGMLPPLAIFLFLQTRWRRRLQEQLPDAFFLLARSLRAGLSLEQAVAMVGDQGVQPLAGEFKRAAEQTRLGITVTAALERMAETVRLTDMNIFVSVIKVHRQVGGNLSLLLDRVAAHTRDRNLFRGQFMASTALGRTTAAFISLATPILLLVYGFMQPDYLIRFAQHPTGFTALLIAGLLQVVGVAWIFYLLRVDY